MPDHVHLLLTPIENPKGGFFSLTEILHSLKSFTGNKINNLLNRHGPLWQEEYFNRILRDETEFLEKWNYIRNNPVKKELCQRPEEWDAFYECQKSSCLVNLSGRTGFQPVYCTGRMPVLPGEEQHPSRIWDHEKINRKPKEINLQK